MTAAIPNKADTFPKLYSFPIGINGYLHIVIDPDTQCYSHIIINNDGTRSYGATTDISSLHALRDGLIAALGTD